MAIWGGHGVRRRGEFWVREGYGDGWKRPREVRVLEGGGGGEGEKKGKRRKNA